MTTSSVDTIEQAIADLAKRATVARKLRKFQKAAGLDMSALSQLIQENPHIAGALLGAGGGAAFGGLTSLARPKHDRQTGGSMLTGALAGAGLGLGGSYLVPYLRGDTSVLGPTNEQSQQLQDWNSQADKLKDQYAQTKPSLAGTFLRDAPLLGAAGAGDVAGNRYVRRMQPQDISEGLLRDARRVAGNIFVPKPADVNLGNETVGQWAHGQYQHLPPTGPLSKERLFHGVRQSWWDRLRAGMGSATHAPLAEHEFDPIFTHPEDRPFGRPPPSLLNRSALENLSEEARLARLEREEIGSAMTPRGVGVRALGYLGLPLLHHYLLRRAQHELESP